MVGWWDSPRRPYARKDKKSKRKKKKGTWERREGLHLPIQVGFGLEGEDFPPWLGRPPWGSLSLKARPPLSHLYIRRF